MSYPPYPTSGAPYPTSGAPYPTIGAPYRTSGTPYPTSGTPYSSGPPQAMPGYPPPSGQYPMPDPHVPGGPGGMPAIPGEPFSGGNTMPMSGGVAPYPPPPLGVGQTSYPTPPAPMPGYGPPPVQSTYPPNPTYPTSTTAYPNHQPPPVAPGPNYGAPVPKPVSTHSNVPVTQAQQKMAAMSISTPPAPVTHGTVLASSNFDAEADSTALYTAMKGFGTNEKAIISVLTKRSNQQRQDIKRKFKAKYGKDLIAELKSELSGNFEKVVLGLMMTHIEYDAHCLYKAMDGPGTDESTLIEILCSRTNEQITAIKECYKKAYKHDLEKDVYCETSGHFRKLLTSLTTAARESDGPVDVRRAKQDAQALYQAGEAKWGTDESVFNKILCVRSQSHLKVVFDEYSKICRYDIEQSISREMSGDLKEGMITIVKCVRDLQSYFSERLYKSMKGLGTDDKTLIRVVVSRCEVDMVEIKSKFGKMYGKSLESFISGDTSGDYKRILLGLIGEL